MANQQQLRRLKQGGVEAWNQCRRENPEVAINLCGANLKGLLLQGVNLSRADIRGANFSEADLTGANLTESKAGLRKQWSILLFLSAMVGTLISGILFVFNGYLISFMFSYSVENIVTSWTSFLVFITLYILLLKKGFISASLFAWAVAGAGAITVVVAGTISATGAISVAISVTAAGLGAVAVAVVFAGGLAGAVAVALAGLVVGSATIAGMAMVTLQSWSQGQSQLCLQS